MNTVSVLFLLRAFNAFFSLLLAVKEHERVISLLRVLHSQMKLMLKQVIGFLLIIKLLLSVIPHETEKSLSNRLTHAQKPQPKIC